MPLIFDPVYLQKLAQALGLRESPGDALSEVDGLTLVVDVGPLLAGMPLALGAQGTGGVAASPRATPPGASVFGNLKTVQVGVPAAGADWTFPVTAGVRWRFRGGVALFATSAVVANRFPGLAHTPATPPIPTTPTTVALPTTAQLAGNGGISIVYVPGLPRDVAATTFYCVSVPSDLALDPGSTIRSLTPGINATDAYSGIFLWVEEWTFP